MTRVSGLDLALGGTGYAAPNGVTFTLRPPARLKAYNRHNWLTERIVEALNGDRPDLVIIEAFAGGGPGRLANIASAEVGGIVKAMLARGLIDFAEVAPSSLKKYATGDGRAKKPDMIAAAYEAGATLSALDADNEADAWLLRHAGRAALGLAEPLGPLPASLAHLTPNR